MTILLGIDADGHYRTALSLLSRLQFRTPRLVLLHVDEQATFPVSLPTLPKFSGAAHPVELHLGDTKALETASREASAIGFEHRTDYEEGVPSEQLLRQASRLPADLIAIGSRQRGPLAASLLGSVGRALASDSTHSFLVAYGDAAPAGKLRCVLATDYSPHTDRCVERILEWAPTGIEEIVLFSALESKSPQSRHGADGTVGGMALDAPTLASRSISLQRRFEAEGIKASIRFGAGPPAEAIRSVMKETCSDLLILGAPGHGFLERLRQGSVAGKIVADADYPVMVVRP